MSKNSNHSIQNGDAKDESSKIQTSNEVKTMILQFLLIIPIIFISAIGAYPFLQISDQLIYVRLGGDISTNSNASQTCQAVNGSGKTHQDKIQSQATILKLYIAVGSCITGIISMPFWGGWSDTIGRQVGLVAAFVGMFIKSGSLLIVAAVPSAPLWILIVSDIVLGLLGKGGAMIFAAAASHVADVAPHGKRTILMLTVEFAYLFSAAIGNVGTGYWIKASGFIPLCLASMCCHVGGLLYTILVFERCADNLAKADGTKPSVLKYISSSWKTFTRARPDRPYVRRLLLILASMLFIYYNGFLGSYNIINLYTLGYPLCWGSLLIGINNAVLVGSSGIFPILFGAIFYKMGPTPWLVLIGLVSGCSGCVLMGLSKTTWMMLLGVTLFAIRALVSGTSRSILADIVDNDEIGAAMAGYGIVAVTADLVSSVAFNSIYSNTVSYCKGCVFFTGAACYGTAVLFLGAFVAVKRISTKDRNYKPIEEQTA